MSDVTGPIAPTAKQRLQATRQALMHELVPSTRAGSPRRSIPGRVDSVLEDREQSELTADAPFDESDTTPSYGSGWFAVARHSARAWWEFHPVRVVGAVAEPVLAEYARQRPLKLIGIAAGVGAALVVTRPWRLVSVGGLAVAALKSSQVSNFALSFLSKNNRK